MVAGGFPPSLKLRRTTVAFSGGGQASGSYPRPRERGDLDANERLRQGEAGAIEVDVDRLREPLLRASLRRFRAGDVDVLRPFPDMRQHGDAVRQHLDEA